jgi:hypothetical protein
MSKDKSTDNQKKLIRMDPDHIFKFNCHPGVSCFTKCCGDITIVLTPYDVIRLKQGLGISSGEFIEKYTIIVPQDKSPIPLVILKMDEKDKKCQLISNDGCTVYNDRPWACRMYPLDMNDDGTFSLITDTSRCQGLNEKDNWKIIDWMEAQGLAPYEEMNELFSEITIPLRSKELDIENPEINQMTFMALYNTDRFREFIFQSSFLDKFDVDQDRVEKIKEDDFELLKFSFDWMKFGLFGQLIFKPKQKP